MPIALNSAGDILALGRSGSDNGVGAIWVFTKDGNGVWNAGSKLVGSGYAGNTPLQGSAVALNSVGNLLAIGGPGDSNSIGATWICKQRLDPGGE